MNYTKEQAKKLQTRVFACEGAQVTAYLKENAAKRLGVDVESVDAIYKINSHQTSVDEIVENFDGYDENGQPIFSYSIEMKEEFKQ